MIVVDALERRRKPRRVIDQMTFEHLDGLAGDLRPLTGATQALVQGGDLGDPVERIAERFEFVDLVAEQALAFAGLGDRSALRGQVATQLCPRRECVAHRLDDRGVDAEVVQEAALHIADQELAVLVLAVDVDQGFGQRAQDLERGGHAVDERPRAAFGRRASDQAGRVVVSRGDREVIEQRADLGALGDVEFRADIAPGCAGAQLRALDAGAEHQ